METSENSLHHHQHHHHHHHHHRIDAASKFKIDSLNSIKRRKQMAKWGLRILMAIAVIMGILVVLAYTIG